MSRSVLKIAIFSENLKNLDFFGNLDRTKSIWARVSGVVQKIKTLEKNLENSSIDDILEICDNSNSLLG
jgi:hypothetical protein